MSDMESQDVFAYITTEKNNYRTARVPLTNSKDWNMYEHIQRCTNVANAWYHQGKNDGMRPYNDIVTPILNVAFRSEGFDVKDIVPFVNSAEHYYKSFLVKKFHPQWARKNQLDTFIDEVVETSIIYDLVLVKDIKDTRPEVVDLKTIAFCDQTDVLAGSICIEHDFSYADLEDMKGKWDSDKIDMAIYATKEDKKVGIANDQTVSTPSPYVKVYELSGNLPAKWLDDTKEGYVNQKQIVCLYTDNTGNKTGITLYKGKDKPLKDNFKALKIDSVRSRGRACGRSIVETLFEPQVWNNYSGIKIKDLLDSAVNVFISDSDELGGQKLSDLKLNTVLKQERGAQTSRLDGSLQNLQAYQNHQIQTENSARIIGSASDAQLGTNPTAGTPFALQSLVVQQGQGIHEYRQGKISTFFADVLYPDLILPYLVKEMNSGKTFSEDLSFDELEEISKTIVTNAVNEELKQAVLDGKDVTPEMQDVLTQVKKETFMQQGTRRFFEILKGELEEIPVEVYVNIKGKQRGMAENADKITNIIRTIIASPQAFTQIPGIGKAFNELLEESGLSPIDFSQVTAPVEPQATTAAPTQTPPPLTTA